MLRTHKSWTSQFLNFLQRYYNQGCMALTFDPWWWRLLYPPPQQWTCRVLGIKGIYPELLLCGLLFRTELIKPKGGRDARSTMYEGWKPKLSCFLNGDAFCVSQAVGVWVPPPHLRAVGVTLVLSCGSVHPAKPPPQGVQCRCIDAAVCHTCLWELPHSTYPVLLEPKTEGCSLWPGWPVTAPTPQTLCWLKGEINKTYQYIQGGESGD